MSSPAIAIDAILRNPFSALLSPGWSLCEVGLYVGWLTALCVYLTLGYMTFFYRWKSESK
jgi:hypothetical protein